MVGIAAVRDHVEAAPGLSALPKHVEQRGIHRRNGSVARTTMPKKTKIRTKGFMRRWVSCVVATAA